MIVSGQFSFGKVSISVENEAFDNRLQRVYELDRESERDAPDYFIRIDDLSEGTSSRYRVAAPSEGLRICSSWAEVAGAVDHFFDATIRACVSPGLVTLHASSAVLDKGAIAFVGRSGSGKTTLSLELAHSSGEYLGDEYAFYRLDSGAYFHEKHPARLKQHGALEGILSLPAISDRGVASFAFSPASIGLPQITGSHKLEAIFFPRFSPRMRQTSIARASLLELPSLLLPSVAGTGDRARLFRALIGSFACHGVWLFTMQYGNSSDAVARIIDQLG